MAFEDAKISKTLSVHSNESDEVFVTNRKSGVVIRISDRGEKLAITAFGYKMLLGSGHLATLVVENMDFLVIFH